MKLVNRRGFLTAAAMGGAHLAFGDVAAALARPRTRHWTRSSAAGGPFKMVVIGDSIMWGQGLREEAKFTTHVQNWIKSQLPGSLVTMHRYAHSGAIIRADEQEDAKPAKPGEVPNPHPSITALFWKAVTELTPETPDRAVDLVLMGGGLSDVKLENILSTDPIMPDRLARIRSLTRERCGLGMARLLPYVLQRFPRAKLVTTSYYPIVSESSDLISLADIVNLHNPARPIAKVTVQLRTALTAQSLAFHEEYVAGVGPVVRQARSLESVASAATAPTRNPVIRDRAVVADASRRTAFVPVPFKPENACAAPRTWIWSWSLTDQVAPTRKQQCYDVEPSPTDKCYLAALGHPNVEGAQAYARAIIAELQAFMPQWKADRQLEATQGERERPAELPTSISPSLRR